MPPEPAGLPDAAAGNWVDRRAPSGWRPFLRLSRADRPAGTWLLLLPCWWGALLAAAERGASLWLVWVLAASALGALLMRGAGCTWNDITDRHIDAQVARTRERPLPAGQVTVRQALIWMAMQAGLAFLVLLTLGPLAILLGIASLALVAIYPFAKRFTWWPQVFLGLAFNWGALLCYAAVAGELSWPAGLLYAAGIAWTLFYDTIYAHQDREDDALIGVRSTARLFGGRTRAWLFGFMVAAVLAMGASVVTALAPLRQALPLALALGAPWAFGWHLAWQLRHLDTDDPASCLRIFRSNRDAGLLAAQFLALSAIP